MSGNVRPKTMERITTKALADAFIEEQLEEISYSLLHTICDRITHEVDGSKGAYEWWYYDSH